jgi:hypothetical protein
MWYEGQHRKRLVKFNFFSFFFEYPVLKGTLANHNYLFYTDFIL